MVLEWEADCVLLTHFIKLTHKLIILPGNSTPGAPSEQQSQPQR